MKKYEFFLRFYCKEEMMMTVVNKWLDTHFFTYKIEESHLSVNFFLPEKVRQINLEFETKEERDRFRLDPEVMRTYTECHPNGQIVERNPGDDVWCHGARYGRS